MSNVNCSFPGAYWLFVTGRRVDKMQYGYELYVLQWGYYGEQWARVVEGVLTRECADPFYRAIYILPLLSYGLCLYI